MRRRCSSPACTIRAREARNSATVARSSASSRSFSKVSAAAAPTVCTSSCSSARPASWTIAATRRPSCSIAGGDLSLRCRIDPHRPSVGVHVRALARHPIGELQGVVSERRRERAAQGAATAAATKLADERVDRLGLVRTGIGAGRAETRTEDRRWTRRGPGSARQRTCSTRRPVRRSATSSRARR